jgi:hypothetical protein
VWQAGALYGTGAGLEPVHDLLRFGDTALKTPWNACLYLDKCRFLSRFRLVSL